MVDLPEHPDHERIWSFKLCDDGGGGGGGGGGEEGDQPSHSAAGSSPSTFFPWFKMHSDLILSTLRDSQ